MALTRAAPCVVASSLIDSDYHSQWLAMLSGGGALCKMEGPFGSIGGLTEATEESRGGEFALMTLPLRAS